MLLLLLLLVDNDGDFLAADALKGRREEDDDNRWLAERKGALFLMLLCSENKINRLKFIDIERVIQHSRDDP